MPTCKNCQQNFTIYPEDKEFYQRIEVPEPTLCPDCRQQRRYAWRNERNFYNRKCDLCGREIISIYSPNKSFKVYCQDCWWSDRWDPFAYGRPINFSQPFLKQWRELQLAVPRLTLVSKNSTNSEYANHSGYNKNAYYSSVIWYSENILYSNWVMRSTDSLDCTYIHEHAELCYELVASRNCYNCRWSSLLFNCHNCFFSYDLRGCHDCFLCYNLRNQNYCILNKQYSEEEYQKKIQAIDFSSFQEVEKLKKQFLELLKTKVIHRSIIEYSENCTGNHIFRSRNCHQCFDAESMENARYCFSCIEAKDCFDAYHFGFGGSQLNYEVHALTNTYNCFFTHFSYDNRYLHYCDSCHNCHDLFGCVGLKKAEFCILNRKYEEETFNKLKIKIIEQMSAQGGSASGGRKTGEYGEFFPAKYSPFGYNETVGQYYMPLAKEKALGLGFNWEDKIPGTTREATVLSKNLPDNIKDISDDICREILQCLACGRSYNIIFSELEFYRKQEIPLPHLCPTCRYLGRMNLRGPRKLWSRKCSKCDKQIEAGFAPDQPEMVYCQECYLKEVY